MQPTTPETVIVEDLHRREQLLAMRHLRPGTQLPQCRGLLARQLQDNLLQLPDECDPLNWLQKERGQVTALLALSLTLDLATQLHHSAQQVLRLHNEPDAPPKYERLAEHLAQQAALFGQLLTSTDEWEVPASYTESITDITTSEQLIGELARLRRQSTVPVESSPDRSLLEPGRKILLADLLRLPEAIDPVRWLEEERGELSARLVLAYLARQSCPPPDFLVTAPHIHTRPSVRPKVRLHVQRTLWMWVEQIDFFELGFALHLHARIHTPGAWAPSRHSTSFMPLQWEGFDRVVDNYGYHYLTQFANYELSNRLWWWRERLTLLCWPSVGDAHELVLQSQPAALAAYRVPLLGDELTPLPGPILGEMRLSIPLH